MLPSSTTGICRGRKTDCTFCTAYAAQQFHQWGSQLRCLVQFLPLSLLLKCFPFAVFKIQSPPESWQQDRAALSSAPGLPLIGPYHPHWPHIRLIAKHCISWGGEASQLHRLLPLLSSGWGLICTSPLGLNNSNVSDTRRNLTWVSSSAFCP